MISVAKSWLADESIISSTDFLATNAVPMRFNLVMPPFDGLSTNRIGSRTLGHIASRVSARQPWKTPLGPLTKAWRLPLRHGGVMPTLLNVLQPSWVRSKYTFEPCVGLFGDSRPRIRLCSTQTLDTMSTLDPPAPPEGIFFDEVSKVRVLDPESSQVSIV